MKKNYLLDIQKAKKQEIEATHKLSDDLNKFEEKYVKKGIHFSALLDYKTKRHLIIELPGAPIDFSFMDPIIEEFQKEFHVELIEKVIFKSYIHDDMSIRWIFRKINYFKDIFMED